MHARDAPFVPEFTYWITSCGDMPSKKVVLVRCWSEGLRDLGSASCQKSHIARERKNLASNGQYLQGS